MFTISVLKNTNKLICSSEDNLSHVREGSFIKIGNDNLIYTISKVNKVFFIKDFEIKSQRLIVINDDIGIKLQKGDTIKISYKEYELNNILEIKKSGKLYVLNEILKIKNGEPVIDLSTGLSDRTELIVERINESGGVSELGLKNAGKYIIPPDGDCQVFSERGEDCILSLEYKLSDSRTTLERKIEEINISDNKTYLRLNYSLPEGVSNGKLSTEKWEITLQSNYIEDTKVNINYQIYKDFTPYLHIPLMVKNSQSADVIYNKGMSIIEEQIVKIKKHLRM